MSWLPAASESARHVDALFFTLLGITGFVALAIAAVVVAFCIRYRRGSPADRSDPPVRHLPLEIAWTITPLAIFLAFFAWGAVVYAGFHRAGDDARVFVVAKQWMWKAEHENGRREIGELHLPVGRRVRVVLATEDVIHSFWVPAFRAKQDAVPGRYTELAFTPTRAGTYDMRCAEYCGTDHASMGGRVVVMAQDEFARWLAQGAGEATMAARGEAAFHRLGCDGCHDAGSTVRAPDLHGLYGRTVRLADGREAKADEAYLRDALLLPRRDVVAGYSPVMPSYQGQVTEAQILDLIAYIRSLGGEAR